MPEPSTPAENNLPTVAVIIPCHNHADYVLDAIQSVLDQDYPGAMLSVVDDGSTDHSLETLRNAMTETHQEYEGEDEDTIYIGQCQHLPMILVHRPEARKQAAARNTAIQLAWSNAELFCQLDADDLYLPGKLSKSVAAWQEAPKFIGLVYSDAIIHNIETDTNVREFRPPFERGLLERENIISNAPLISKDALAYSGLYDEDLPPCEDWDLWLRITENFMATHLPEPLQQYTVTGQNCTFTVPMEKWQEQWTKVQQKLAKRMQLRYGQ
jgi:glycosyltransferase involved in cell wall biosynthesis